MAMAIHARGLSDQLVVECRKKRSASAVANDADCRAIVALSPR